jgi:hypothetical protein
MKVMQQGLLDVLLDVETVWHGSSGAPVATTVASNPAGDETSGDGSEREDIRPLSTARDEAGDDGQRGGYTQVHELQDQDGGEAPETDGLAIYPNGTNIACASYAGSVSPAGEVLHIMGIIEEPSYCND